MSSVKWEEVKVEEFTSRVFFKFEAVGDMIVGRYVKMQEEEGRYGKQMVVYLRTRDGDECLNANFDLQRRFEAAELAKGDLVRVTFAGWVDLKDDKKMKQFTLEVNRDRPPIADPKDVKPVPAARPAPAARLAPARAAPPPVADDLPPGDDDIPF